MISKQHRVGRATGEGSQKALGGVGKSHSSRQWVGTYSQDTHRTKHP